VNTRSDATLNATLEHSRGGSVLATTDKWIRTCVHFDDWGVGHQWWFRLQLHDCAVLNEFETESLPTGMLFHAVSLKPRVLPTGMLFHAVHLVVI
jgi:hypothetical protein